MRGFTALLLQGIYCITVANSYQFHSLQIENVRRRHNYLPFIMELLKVLAKKGDLIPLVERVSKSHCILWYVCFSFWFRSYYSQGRRNHPKLGGMTFQGHIFGKKGTLIRIGCIYEYIYCQYIALPCRTSSGLLLTHSLLFFVGHNKSYTGLILKI